MPDSPAPQYAPLDTPGRQPVVCVQGVGFVGAAVCIAVASARNAAGHPAYRVIGVDLPTPEGLARIASLNRGVFPFAAADSRLQAKACEACAAGNLSACADPTVFGFADVIIVDLPLDVITTGGEDTLDLPAFKSAVRMVGVQMHPDALVIVETTVAPGTTALLVAPALKHELALRGLPTDRFKLAHCYERVMPGANYLDSILNMPRVYAGLNERSANACGAFLCTVVDAARYPPVRLSSTTASELGKVLENTYRAVTIALMDEFADFAEKVGVDLYEIIAPIRDRPSHSNIRVPGFGVGGYCLTKDPLLPELAARQLFGMEQVFPFASLAVRVNRMAPQRTLRRLRELLAGSLRGKRILLLGVSYREDVGDTRHSPSQIFYDAAQAEGAEIQVHDPMVGYWREQHITVPSDVPLATGLDAVVLAVPHTLYRTFAYATWLGCGRPLFLDAFGVLSSDQRSALRALGCTVESIGRGAGL